MESHRKFMMLNWDNRDKVISYNFHQYFIEGKFCDSSISCEGKLIPVHRIMMASVSKYFKNIFEATAERQTIVLQDVAYEDLILIVKFAYTGEAKILSENYKRFMITAKHLQIKGMVDKVPTLGHRESPFSSPAQPNTTTKGVAAETPSMITLPTPPRESSAENSPNVSKNDSILNPFAVKPEPVSPEPKDSAREEKRKRESPETFSNPYDDDDYDYEPPSKVKRAAKRAAPNKVAKKSTPKVKSNKNPPATETAPCRFCSKLYSVKSLYSHTVSCKGNPDRKIYECPICHKQLSRADKLSYHIATHSNKDQVGPKTGDAQGS